MKTLLDNIIEQIENLSSADLVELNNQYSQDNDLDGGIYENDEDFLNEHFSEPAEAVRAAYYGDYTFNHPYVRYNGYGNLESLDSIDASDLCDSVSIIAEYAIDNQRDYDHILDFDFEEGE